MWLCDSALVSPWSGVGARDTPLGNSSGNAGTAHIGLLPSMPPSDHPLTPGLTQPLLIFPPQGGTLLPIPTISSHQPSISFSVLWGTMATVPWELAFQGAL